MAKKIVAKTLIYAILIFLVILTLVPFYLIMVNATHSSFQIVTQLNVCPGGYLKENYEKLQQYVNIWSGFFNSVLVSV